MLQPDKWQILKIKYKRAIVYKLLSGWYGGPFLGDSWRLNSGITSITEDGDYYIISGHGSTTYKCYRHGEGMSLLMYSIFEAIKEHAQPISLEEYYESHL